MTNLAEPPAGFPRPTEMPFPQATYPAPYQGLYQATYQAPYGAPHPSAPFPTPTPSPEPSPIRRHLGAVLVAVAILLVGGAGVVTWAAASGHDSVASTPSSSVTSPSTSSDSSGSSSSGETYQDMSYLSVLRQAGVPFASDAGAIQGGQGVCTALGQGIAPGPLVMSIVTAQNSPFTTKQAATIVGAAIGAYCPQYKYELQ